ncbi:hypothetical protein DFH09DRAFT_1367026 [Mycena vulgaris]|nr:hypothetical protein DFH09DRAFT_1367026 [Mycena vulgaris]
MRLFVALLALAATSVSARPGNLEGLAACGAKRITNATIEADGHALHWYTCEAKPPARVEARDGWEAPVQNGVQWQTCTQCPCANSSIQCFCSNTPGESGDSRLFIYGCSNPTPLNPNVPMPVTANYTPVANLIVNGAPTGLPPSLHEFANNPI